MKDFIKTLVLLVAAAYVAQAEICKNQVDPNECEKAIEKIGFDAKGNVYKSVNKVVGTSGNCKVIIQTKSGSPIASSGSGLSAALNKIVDRKHGECNHQGGVEDIQNPTNIPNFQPATLLVKHESGVCKGQLDPTECQKALGKIGYDTKGNVYLATGEDVLACGHCKIVIHTKNGEPIAASGSGLSSALNTILDRVHGQTQCRNQPGVEKIQNPTNIPNFHPATLLVERLNEAAPCAWASEFLVSAHVDTVWSFVVWFTFTQSFESLWAFWKPKIYFYLWFSNHPFSVFFIYKVSNNVVVEQWMFFLDRKSVV